MRILLAASVSPFTGREELHWMHAISKGIKELGFKIDTFMLPIVQNPLLLPGQMMALRLLNIKAICDLLITVGYPAFVLNHPRKRVLLFSLASPLHEWFDSEYGVLATPQYQSIRRDVQNAEKKCLLDAERIICGSTMLAKKLESEYSLNPSAFILDDTCAEKSNINLPEKEFWVVAESTLEPCDRVDMLLDAVAFSNENWKLNIFVPSASGVYYSALLKRMKRLGIKERIVITTGSLLLGVLENSFVHIMLRYMTTRIPECVIRAIKSNVPTLTLSDCGALLEVVMNNINGLIVEPNANKIAQTLDRISVDTKLAKQLSEGNHELVNRVTDINTVIQRLVS